MHEAECPTELWPNYRYFEVYRRRFDPEECQAIIQLHRLNPAMPSKMWGAGGSTLRDSDLFWIPRRTDTEWIFCRLREIITQYNRDYNFELAEEFGQAQLTRYRTGQHYQWHMDLGSGQLSLRKITAVIELTSKELMTGGGIEVFYGQSVDNKVDLDIGDVIVFPSFVMHRALVVQGGTRWSLVFWLNGTKPLR